MTKAFYYYTHRPTSMREWFIHKVMRRPRPAQDPDFALNEFNLSVNRGEIVAMIGPNGSGKSTALRLLAGIYTPTTGEIQIRGRLTSVIELGAGFHPELTGVENAMLYASVIGLTPQELEERKWDILHFADIGDFVNMPVKYYSTGMQARLAFAVAMSTQPDVVLLDEVMAVGDEIFRTKCIEALLEYKKQGGTIIVVSHELDAIKSLCDWAIWMEQGRMRMRGPAEQVVDAYREAAAVGAG